MATHGYTWPAVLPEGFVWQRHAFGVLPREQRTFASQNLGSSSAGDQHGFHWGMAPERWDEGTEGVEIAIDPTRCQQFSSVLFEFINNINIYR